MKIHASNAGSVALSISGMTCSGCANAVTRVLSRVPGVASARVDLASGRAVVVGEARPEDLIVAVEAAGFEAQRAPGEASGDLQ
ncbi:MAG TPA: heavy metal-associated domain-containing protein [Roseiarcus sp.]|jgi:copper chaperone CopZ